LVSDYFFTSKTLEYCSNACTYLNTYKSALKIAVGVKLGSQSSHRTDVEAVVNSVKRGRLRTRKRD